MSYCQIFSNKHVPQTSFEGTKLSHKHQHAHDVSKT